MIKTLTEQWKNGELDGGFYYLEMKDGLKQTDHTVYVVGEKVFRWGICSVDYVKEVLAPVPSYEEYKELLRHSELSRNLVYEVLVNQKEYNELLDKAKENKRLQEQIKEANDVIISVAVMPRFPVNPELCREYLKKWGVK